MSTNGKFLLGSVLERKPTGPAQPPRSTNLGPHGFPTAQHRSKSAFARNREKTRKTTSGEKDLRSQAPPIVVPTQTVASDDVKPANAISDTDNQWRKHMSEENEMRVADMTEEEREAEKREILGRFGTRIGDVLKRAQLAREQNAAKDVRPGLKNKPLPPPSEADTEAFKNMLEVPISEEEPVLSRSSERGISPPPALSRPHSRPSSRLDRKLRFAELGPSDVFVYESAPPSPKRKPLLLPSSLNDGTAVSLGQWHGKPGPPPAQPEVTATRQEDAVEPQSEEPEEGTSEYIRRRYFPNVPANDPNLAWMQWNPFPAASDQPLHSLRFDLKGNVIPSSIAAKLPTHLGLHHHAEGITAGYTLDDIFLLSRSTVPPQRATMLDILARIVLNLGKTIRGELQGLEELIPKVEEIRKRILAAGIEAINERGGVGARAIEAAWASLVGWDEDALTIEGVELERDSDTIFFSLQLDHFLPQIANVLSQGDVLPESLIQLLAILHRIALQSNKAAAAIVQTPKLISSVFQVFLLTSIPPIENGPLPEPAALQFLMTLASASRTNAESLKEPAEVLLRFIALLPSSSPFPFPLATSLLIHTLQFYRVLASYGLYSNVATIAVEPFSQLSQFVLSSSCDSSLLKIAWLDLLSTWTVCAVDPHKTKPDHDILWSQVVGWGWKDEVTRFASTLGDFESDWKVWRAVWGFEARWLEGSKVNAIKGGEEERNEFLGLAGPEYLGGARGRVLLSAADSLKNELDAEGVVNDLARAAFHARLLSAGIRLWLACLPPHLEGPPSLPPFTLPIPLISGVCARLVTHPLWASIGSNEVDPRNYALARQLSGLLAAYLSLSRKLPGISEDLWVAQALAIIVRLIPGDEDIAMDIFGQLLGLLTSSWVNTQNILSPPLIWEKGGLDILQPFLSHSILSKNNSDIAPLWITPRSIASSSTLRLPMSSRRKDFGLPLSGDWALAPLNQLLRSADSEVFKDLPSGWDSSEVEVVRASLFFSILSRNTLSSCSLPQFALSKEEAVFGCMRVFMLEHGQPDNSSGEVFRDNVVGGLMNQLLKPYVYENSSSRAWGPTQNLEQVAARFLGDSTPFFQFYTDFVALYDAVSFSDATFAKLLLPPASMLYAIDYRKHLWDDFNHIIKTIRTPIEQVLSNDLKEYLYPIENDSQLIGAYLRALLKEPLQGFVRLIVVHHIASSIWPDLRDVGSSSEARAEKLIKAVAVQGNNEVVRDIVGYRQVQRGPAWLPPVCFGVVSEVASVRLSWVRALEDDTVNSRVEGLLI